MVLTDHPLLPSANDIPRVGPLGLLSSGNRILFVFSELASLLWVDDRGKAGRWESRITSTKWKRLPHRRIPIAMLGATAFADALKFTLVIFALAALTFRLAGVNLYPLLLGASRDC